MVLWSGTEGRQKRARAETGVEARFIAEFVAQQRHRPEGYLLRPDKVLGRSSWFGDSDSPLYSRPEDQFDFLRRNRVRLIIWRDGSGEVRPTHEQLLRDVLNSPAWSKVAVFRGEGRATSWAIYEQLALQESRSSRRIVDARRGNY